MIKTRRALIVWGGWDGHQPREVADLFKEILENESFDVEVSETLDRFCDHPDLNSLNLIVPIWTMGEITPAQRDPVLVAVRDHGVGLAGCHGGMCDAFRNDTEWQFMTGGQWVAHPGNDSVRYHVNFTQAKHEITDGLTDFETVSEQYYLHTDPGNLVLATTEFPAPGVDGPHVRNRCQMPQVWIKYFGEGKVFYNALGHQRHTLEEPVPHELMRRGFLWAAKD